MAATQPLDSPNVQNSLCRKFGLEETYSI